MASLTPEVHKRILALKKLQIETIELDATFHRKIYEMEMDFQKKHDDVFQKRLEIILGNREPSEEECQLPAQISEISEKISEMALKDESEPEKDIKGIPNFWLTVLKYIPKIEMMVKEHDEPVLKVINKIVFNLPFFTNFYFVHSI